MYTTQLKRSTGFFVCVLSVPLIPGAETFSFVVLFFVTIWGPRHGSHPSGGQWGPLNKKLLRALEGVVLRLGLAVKRELPGGVLR